MHELSLYGSVPVEQYHRILQQLAGVTCMQPQNAEEVHIILKSRIPPGLEKVQGSSGGQGSQQQQQEIQRLKGLLQGGIYNVKLVGKISPRDSSSKLEENGTNMQLDATEQSDNRSGQSIEWFFEFKDTPAAGKQATNVRLISRTKLGSGDLVAFLGIFGFDYVTRYYVEGCRFYNQDTTLFLHRIRQIPGSRKSEDACDISKLPPRDQLPLIDATETYILQASIDIVDGNSEDLKNRASEQLISIRETLKQAVTLAPADRLALDMRIAVPMRRV